MRWHDATRALAAAAGWAWLLLPLAAEASRAHMAPVTATGMPAAMGQFTVMTGALKSSSATDCPPCISCYMAPAPAAKPPVETDGAPESAAWVHRVGPLRAADGWHVLAPLAPGVPLRIALCRWRD